MKKIIIIVCAVALVALTVVLGEDLEERKLFTKLPIRVEAAEGDDN